MGGLGIAVVVICAGVAFSVAAPQLRRRSRKSLKPIDKADPESIVLDDGMRPSQVDPMACPMCLSEYPPGHGYCIKDGAALVQDTPEAPGAICPTCERAFPPQSRFCPHDAEELIPYAQFKAQLAQRTIPPLPTTKICPRCGQGYTAVQGFCGVDGSELIVLN